MERVQGGANREMHNVDVCINAWCLSADPTESRTDWHETLCICDVILAASVHYAFSFPPVAPFVSE